MIPLLLAGMGIGALGNVVSSAIGANASNKAAGAQQKAVGRAQGQITDAYNQAQGYQQPYYSLGTQNARTLSGMVNNGAFGVDPYNYTIQQDPNLQFNFQADPGYDWRMQQGTQAINSNAAAQGNQLSGATLKALAKYGQGLASQEYANAFDRYNTNRNFAQGQYQFGTQMGMQNALNRYNSANQQANQNYDRYNNLAGMGQTAAGNMANMANAYGANMADTTIQGGNARASGIMGQGNAWANGINNLAGMATLGGMMAGGGMGGAGRTAPALANVDTNTAANLPYYG